MLQNGYMIPKTLTLLRVFRNGHLKKENFSRDSWAGLVLPSPSPGSRILFSSNPKRKTS